jgi:O-antigen/teichoic acid export membrane protein
VANQEAQNGSGSGEPPSDPPGGDENGGAGAVTGRQFLVGTALLGAGNSLSSAVNLAIGIALARILGPEEFGLFAFVVGINELLGIVGAFSLGSALIQAREESQALYDTAFAMCAGLGFAMIAIGLALAPVLDAHRGPEAATFLIVLVTSSWFRLVAQVPRAKLERTLRYDVMTRNAVVSSSVPNFVALGLAYSGIGAWALVWRDVLVSLLTFALESISSRYRFQRRIGRIEFRQLMDFAKPMFVARGIDILVERVDRVAVGSFLGNAAAGLLDRARFLADIGLYVMRPVERACLNLLSRVQDDHVRSSRAYSLVNFFLVRMMFAGAIVLLLVPEQTLQFVLGDEWTAAAPALRWLAVHAAIYPVYSMVKILAITRNCVGRVARISAVQAVVLIPGTLTAAYLGSFTAVAAVVALTTCLGALLGVMWTRDLVTVSYRSLFTAPLISAAVTACLLFGAIAQGVTAGLPSFVLPLSVGACFVVSLAVLEGRQLLTEFSYLRAQLGAGDSDAEEGA